MVCHPHPLHGGTMHTKAVFRAAQAMEEIGLAALRFNFRGVGASTGSYEEGVGEQEDVGAALDWLEEEFPGLPLVLGGFSFGSMVALRVGTVDPRPVALFGMGMPLGMYDYSFLGETGRPVLVVQGEEDEFGSGREADDALGPLGDHVTVVRVAGADHYFNDRFDDLKAAIRDFFEAGPGGTALRSARPDTSGGREEARAEA